MKIALLTYSTKPRGGVVHTLSLAEALAAAGADVTVWTLGRGGDDGVRPRRRARTAPAAGHPDLWRSAWWSAPEHRWRFR